MHSLVHIHICVDTLDTHVCWCMCVRVLVRTQTLESRLREQSDSKFGCCRLITPCFFFSIRVGTFFSSLLFFGCPNAYVFAAAAAFAALCTYENIRSIFFTYPLTYFVWKLRLCKRSEKKVARTHARTNEKFSLYSVRPSLRD